MIIPEEQLSSFLTIFRKKTPSNFIQDLVRMTSRVTTIGFDEVESSIQ